VGLAFWILLVSITLGVGSASALAWRWSFGFGTLASTTSTGTAVDKSVWEDDLAALRKEMAQSAQARVQLLAAQEAKINWLSGQVVTLSSKLEQMPAPLVSTVGTPTWQADLAALRRELAQASQTNHQSRGAQDAQLRSLFDQVAALSNKLELLHPMAYAQAAMAGPAPKPAGALATAAVRKSAITLPKKRPEVPDPTAVKPADTQTGRPAET
jgi:hypothetical protein